MTFATRRSHLVFVALVASLGVRSVASAQAKPQVRIDVDATEVGTPLESVWAYYGYDEVNYTTTKEGERLLRALADANTAPPYIRTHFLFNTGDGTPGLKWGSTNIYSEDADGNPVYSYTLIDQVMDATVDAGALPFVELGFMPEALSTRPDPYRNGGPYTLDGGCFYPPNDYDKWGELVAAWARHVKRRYPDAGSTWQWELWNEPDIGYWQGTFDEYAKLYDYTEAALHAVFPDAELGGPAVTNPAGSFLSDFLQHCASGTNAVTGQTGTRLDLLTFHAKGGVSIENEHVRMDLGNQLRLHRSGFEVAKASDAFSRRPIVISEADPDGCAACTPRMWPEDEYRNTPAYGAYEVAMMKHSLELASEMGVNLRGVLTWAFTFPDSPYFAGYRALATNGIHLPVMNAFKLLGRLAGNRLPVTSSGAPSLANILRDSVRAQPDVDALATRDGSRIQILVWNYHDDLVEAEPTPIELYVSVPRTFGAEALVTHTRVDETHGDAYTVWVSQGNPDPPSSAELTELRDAMEPVVLDAGSRVPVTDSALQLSFDLPRFGLSLVTLTPSAPIAPSDAGPEAAARSGAVCSFRPLPPAGGPLRTLLALSLALAVTRRQSSRRAMHPRHHTQRRIFTACASRET